MNKITLTAIMVTWALSSCKKEEGVNTVSFTWGSQMAKQWNTESREELNFYVDGTLIATESPYNYYKSTCTTAPVSHVTSSDKVNYRVVDKWGHQVASGSVRLDGCTLIELIP